MKRWILALLLALGCAGVSVHAAGEYRTVEVESLKITIDSEWGLRTTPGYVPVRFDITNLGEARVIDIVGEGTRFFRMSRAPGTVGATQIRQAVRLGRGDRVRLTVPLPVFADNENVRFEIREDGRTLEQFSFSTFNSASSPNDASVLIVADPASDYRARVTDWRRPITATARASMGMGSRTPPPLDFLLEPGRLPTNWIGYTSLRAVVVGAREWEQLNEAQKSALMTWTACGGDLILADGEPGARAHFFGRIHRTTAEAITRDGLASVLAAADKVHDPTWALPVNRASDWNLIAARGFRLPVPGVHGVPARAYLIILIAFSLLIGPANYWLLWRKRQQVLFVLTAPLISVLFIVVLAGYVVAGEGLAVSGRAVTFTMLDQAKAQAVTRGSASLYAAGMTPSGGLRFARDVAVVAIGPDGSGNRGQQVIDLTDQQRFASGVIQARAPTNLEVVSFRPARERLAFTSSGDTVHVVNALGATVTHLLYRSGGKVYSLTGPLPEGGRGTLKPGSPAPSAVVPAGLPLTTRFEYLLAHQPDGSYLAVLERSPFWNAGVHDVVERASFHLVIGWPEGQP
jgi:hypothetical protein